VSDDLYQNLYQNDSADQRIARRTLAQIKQLRECSAFIDYFLPRVRKMAEEFRVALVDTSKKGKELKRIQREHRAVMKVLELIEDDEVGSRNVMGIIPAADG